MTRSTVSGHFIQGAKGPLFVLLRQPAGTATGCVLVVPPFAEEMNKCRRMVTVTALGLVEQGLATVVPDLYGTGDSGGDFSDGDWATWQEDLAVTARWSAGVGHPIKGLLAVRFGCALALDAVRACGIPAMQRSVFWQPVFDGGRFLGQFLRLRIAASLMEDRKETLTGLRERLEGGEVLEVAGYGLSGRLAADLEAATPPSQLPESFGIISWLEVVRDTEAPLPSSSTQLIDSTRTLGGSIRAAGFLGEPFWSTTEIVVNHSIVTHTLAHFRGGSQCEGA